MEVSTQPGVEQTKPGSCSSATCTATSPWNASSSCDSPGSCASRTSGSDRRGDDAGERGLELEKDPSDEATAVADGASSRTPGVFLVPTMNPDGFSAKRRNNAASKDLNRDFPISSTNPMPARFDARNRRRR